jgi:hypothetical protein
MKKWKDSSPYGFVAYYIQAPCHRGAGWMGKRAALVGMGWKLLPVYVGQQVDGVSPCSHNVLTAAQGETDAADASAKVLAQGFGAGSYAYLDIERSDAFPANLKAYIEAWIKKFAAGPFRPGVYCHKHNAADVRATVLGALPAGIEPRFWVVGGMTAQFNIASSKPTDVGVSFANLWQCPQSVTKTFGGVSINIDENVSQWADPAGPILTT